MNRETILSAACEILRDFGLTDLSMRRLAKNLGVAPGAIYWHFPSKQELLGGIAEDLLRGLPRPEPGAEPRAEEFAEAFFGCLTSVRDGAEITLAAQASGTLSRDLREEFATVLGCEDHLAPGDAPQVGALTLLRFLFGSALDIQAVEAVTRSLPTPPPVVPAAPGATADPPASPVPASPIPASPVPAEPQPTVRVPAEVTTGIRTILAGLRGGATIADDPRGRRERP